LKILASYDVKLANYVDEKRKSRHVKLAALGPHAALLLFLLPELEFTLIRKKSGKIYLKNSSTAKKALILYLKMNLKASHRILN
jgi:hypothetical protein